MDQDDITTKSYDEKNQDGGDQRGSEELQGTKNRPTSVILDGTPNHTSSLKYAITEALVVFPFILKLSKLELRK